MVRKKLTQSLLFIAFALLILSIMVATLAWRLRQISKTRSLYSEGARAFHLAQAGVERAKNELRNDWNWPGLDVWPAGGDDDPNRHTPNDETVKLGGGEYWVDLQVISATQIRVISHGWVGKAHRVIEVELSGFPPHIPNCYSSSGAITVAVAHSLRGIPGYDPATYRYSGPACHQKHNCRRQGANCDFHLNDDGASRLHACNMIGFEKVESYHRYNYANCCDNPVYEYNGSRWIADESCSWLGGNNHCTQRLCCENPYPRCSNNRDDDGDGFIDYDGLDVDGDGLINTVGVDYWPDPDCLSPDDDGERPAGADIIQLISWREAL